MISCLIRLDPHRSPNFPRGIHHHHLSNYCHIAMGTMCTSIRTELLKLFRGVRFVLERVPPRIPSKTVVHYERVLFPSDRLPPWALPNPRKPSLVSYLFVCVYCLMPSRKPLAIEHSLRSRRPPSRTIPLPLHERPEWAPVRVSSSAVEVDDVHRKVLGRLPRGEYSTAMLPVLLSTL